MTCCIAKHIGESQQNSPHSHFLTDQSTRKQVKADNAIAHSRQPAATPKAPDTQIAAAEVRPPILIVSAC
jgi:hypothetical protein